MAARFLVLDGPDGCGKSTQARLLVERLEGLGRRPLAVRDPGSTAVGDRIREILLDPRHGEMAVRAELLLYLAARSQLLEERIRPALAKGRDVVCDRFLTATVAYQGHAGGLEPEWIWRIGREVAGPPDPDLCVLLDLDAREALDRTSARPDRMEERGRTFHERVRDGFRNIAESAPVPAVLVPADGPVEEVAARVWREVGRVL